MSRESSLAIEPSWFCLRMHSQAGPVQNEGRVGPHYLQLVECLQCFGVLTYQGLQEIVGAAQGR